VERSILKSLCFAAFVLGLRQTNQHSLSSLSAFVSSAYHFCSFCISAFLHFCISILLLHLCDIFDLLLSQPQAGFCIPTFTFQLFLSRSDQDACSKLRCSSSQRDFPLHQRTESGCNGRNCRSDCKLCGCDQQCWYRASKRDSWNFEYCMCFDQFCISLISANPDKDLHRNSVHPDQHSILHGSSEPGIVHHDCR
jgi:hypothetical protein